MGLERTFRDFLGHPYGRVECSRRGEFPLSEALRLYPELAEGRVWKFERNKPCHGSKNVDQKRKSRVSLDYLTPEYHFRDALLKMTMPFDYLCE
jgi:hypothetical protein